MPTPHYLRFARALALCSSLAVVPGCPSASENTDAGGNDAPSDAPRTPDAPSTEDGGALADAGVDAPVEALDGGDCSTCDCGFTAGDAGLPSCDSLGFLTCCAAVGPLAPPDLPA